MFDSKVEQLASMIIENDTTSKVEKDILIYGFTPFLEQVISIISTIIIGIVFGMLLESIIFLISYASLRVYAGGYHAKSYGKCYIYSVAMILLALIVISNIYLYPRMSISILAISTAIIMKLAPIEAKNKPLEPIEVIVYRRKTITILWTLVLIALTLLFLDLNIYFASIVIAIMCVSIMLILGKCLSME